MRFFRVKIGYKQEEFVPIDETELETALKVFLTDSKGVFKNGVVRGKDIISITEDWHREMGWNIGHQLENEDWNELRQKGILKKYTGAIAEAKVNVLKSLKALEGKRLE